MSQFLDMVRLPNFGLGLAKGQFDDVSAVHVIGAVPAMSQNQTGTIWDVNDTTYPWASWASAGTLSIPAVNASDDGKSVVLIGLDSDYNVLTETVEVSSSGATATTGSFLRLNSAYITNGSATNVGNIVIQKSGTTVGTIRAGNAQTSQAIYTLPANHTGYLIKGVCTCQSGADATGKMFVRTFGQESFRLGHSFEVAGSGGEYEYTFGIPFKIAPKSDIDVRCTVRSNNARVTAAFDIILDND